MMTMNANLLFVLREIATNPGQPRAAVRRKLCARNGKPDNYYEWYFYAANAYQKAYGRKLGLDYGYYELSGRELHLTLAGRWKLTELMEEEENEGMADFDGLNNGPKTAPWNR